MADDAGCAGCSRRALIRGLAMTAAGAALAACRGSEASVDGSSDGEPTDAARPIAVMCGANMCIDLTNPAAGALTAVGGTVVIDVPGDRVIVLRETTTTFIALSDICTHAGCGVAFDDTIDRMACPCHGSQFDLTGAVFRGPARLPLTSYATTFDMTAQLLTITL